MLNDTLANFYEKDIRKLIEEVNLFKNEEDLWITQGDVKNSAGNLVLHIVGGTSYLIGTALAQTGYVRHRDLEFTRKGVAREELIAQLEALIPMIAKALNTQSLEGEYPNLFDNMKVSNGYVFIRLLAHLDYHLGQVNYLRRMLQ
jgi:hypothetical protein